MKENKKHCHNYSDFFPYSNYSENSLSWTWYKLLEVEVAEIFFVNLYHQIRQEQTNLLLQN